MKYEQIAMGREKARQMIQQAQVNVSAQELDGMEITDFGLDYWPVEGAQIVTLLNTQNVGMKIICLFKGQSLPEHWHTGEGTYPGKEETLRVISGSLRLGLEGSPTLAESELPAGKPHCYTCRHVVLLAQTQQITLLPGSKHWMQGGEEGAVVYSISTMATCARDPFTDPNVRRFPPNY